MTGAQYKAAIAALGLTQEEAGEFLGIGGRTSRRYAANGAPKAVAMLLALMVERKIKIDAFTPGGGLRRAA